MWEAAPDVRTVDLLAVSTGLAAAVGGEERQSPSTGDRRELDLVDNVANNHDRCSPERCRAGPRNTERSTMPSEIERLRRSHPRADGAEPRRLRPVGRTRRRVALACGVVVVLGLLSACGSSDDSSSAPEGKEQVCAARDQLDRKSVV